jgi:phosphoadenosine phosphosulfate reductase
MVPSDAPSTDAIRTASAAVREDLARASRSLESASPPEIIRWAADRYGDKLTMATAFGPEGCLIIHWLAAIAPKTYVFNLDTGYQFPETLALRDRIAKRYGIEVAMERPTLAVADYERAHGGPLYRTDPDRCCGDRKLAVVTRVLADFGAWMSGIRRDQSPDRATAPIVGWDHKFGVVKISPLANWTKAKVWDAIVREDVPYNPLHDQGYVSIGCAPCTRAVTFGEDERAGRWSGSVKTECGLHSR